MERKHSKLALAVATALGLAMTTPLYAADSGGDNTNSKTNAAVKRSEGLPTDQRAQNETPNTTTMAPSHTPSSMNSGRVAAGAPAGNSFDKTGAGMSGWASDYATAHKGRITRQAYLDEMNRRWQGIDKAGQGLTPAEVSQLYGNVDSAAPFTPNGSGVQAGNMGPGSAKGQ